MEYKILASYSISGLIDDINKYIKDGWKPQGGVSVKSHTVQDPKVFLQAIIKGDIQ